MNIETTIQSCGCDLGAASKESVTVHSGKIGCEIKQTYLSLSLQLHAVRKTLNQLHTHTQSQMYIKRDIISLKAPTRGDNTLKVVMGTRGYAKVQKFLSEYDQVFVLVSYAVCMMY